ncbi:MAG TPA: hypothetical protein VFS47_01640 [Steroidobacteraceae bacterium]|nr:hypothetical protein [Steroidobacteraceae bacterium]
MNNPISAATVIPWGQRSYSDPSTEPACLTDLAVAQLRAEGQQYISQQDVDQRIKQIVADHNRKVAQAALGPDAIDHQGQAEPQAVEAKVAELEQTQQWLTVDGHRVRVIPNHRGDGSLGTDGWDAHKDGGDLVHEGETIFVTPHAAATDQKAGATNPSAAGQPSGPQSGSANANPTALPPNAATDPKFVPTRQQLTQYAQTKGWGADITSRMDALGAKRGEQAAWVLAKNDGFANLTGAQRRFALDAALKGDQGPQRVLKLIRSDAFKSLRGNAPRRSSQDTVGAKDIVLQRYADPDLAFALDTTMQEEKFKSLDSASKQGNVLVFMALYAGRSDEGYGKLPAGESRRHILASLSSQVLTDSGFLDLIDAPSNTADIDRAHARIDDFVKAHC